MTPTFAHNVNSSFFLWFDNFLMRKGEAYKTYTTRLYNYTDDRLGNAKVVYGSPFKQWVYDKSITGATIPTGFLINGINTPTGTSGMFIDFDNGRIIFDSGVSKTLNITGTYSVKELNTYVTDQTEDNLIIEGKYVTNSRFTISEDYVKPYNPVTPCVFISMEGTHNEAFALGGQDETTTRMKAVIFAENIYQLDGTLSLFADAYNTCFNVIPMGQYPLAEFSNLKTGLYPSGYNYPNLAKNYTNDKCYIYHVNTSKIRDNVLKELNPILHIGFIDFDIGTIRYPRI